MLEDIYALDENLTEDEYYDALLFVLGDVYPDLPEEDLEDVLEDMLDQIPEQYAESVLSTIGNVGKKIGTGALELTSKYPTITQTATTTAGTLIGGPIGAKVGYEAGKIITRKGQNDFLPETGKALAVMQNPQAQAAVTRATLGIGDGTAPLNQNGNVNLVPVATYLRALIASAQAALKELDNKNIIPSASFSEAMPYADDVDMQAEWLAEQLSK